MNLLLRKARLESESFFSPLTLTLLNLIEMMTNARSNHGKYLTNLLDMKQNHLCFNIAAIFILNYLIQGILAYCSEPTAVKGNIKNEGLAMVVSSISSSSISTEKI